MRFSEAFALNKSQWELDFVDVELDGDQPLFLDPFALSQRVDLWSMRAHEILCRFFQSILDALRAGRLNAARRLLGHLHEPNETRLGLSRGKPMGAGIGHAQADKLIAALTKSTAFKTGSLGNLEECELWVESVSYDKISDLATNVLRGRLAEYTKDQCELHGISTRSYPLPPCFDHDQHLWVASYHELPGHKNKPVLLVPKAIVRAKPAYDAADFYNFDVLEFLQAEHLNAGSSLVQSFKSGRQFVTKKDLKERHPFDKEFLAQFSIEHPDVLADYRARLEKRELQLVATPWGTEDDLLVASALIKTLKSIPSGEALAGRYHSLMVGVIELLFWPHIMCPRKETRIHEGRKRIDITAENAARAGTFERLHRVHKIPCPYFLYECKNYSRDIANPELDQLSGRFSVHRGQVGFVLCRSFEDRARFVARCRDTFVDGRGLIVALDDEILSDLLQRLADGERDQLDARFTELLDEVRLA